MAFIKREILTSRKVVYTKSSTRNQFLFCKKMLSKIRIFSLKISAYAKTKLTQLVCKGTKEWVNKVNLSSFLLKKRFEICACVICARKGKHLDVTTMFTYSHANTPLGPKSNERRPEICLRSKSSSSETSPSLAVFFRIIFTS